MRRHAQSEAAEIDLDSFHFLDHMRHRGRLKGGGIVEGSVHGAGEELRGRNCGGKQCGTRRFGEDLCALRGVKLLG